MSPKQHLINLKIEKLKKDYPNFPVNAIPTPKYIDTNANGLTKCIIDWLQLNGHQAERINTMGVARVEKGITDEVFNRGTPQKITWTKGTGTKGSADISATIKGFSVKIEVKYGKDRQSDAQKKYEETVKAAGGVYYIARDFDSFYDWYNKLIAQLNNFTLNL